MEAEPLTIHQTQSNNEQDASQAPPAQCIYLSNTELRWFRNMAYPSENILAVHNCRSWRCPLHSTQLLNSWKNHAKQLMSHKVYIKGIGIRVKVTSPELWPAMRQRLLRSNAGYIRVITGINTVQLVFNDGDEGEVIKVDEAIFMFNSAVDSMPRERNRISASRGPKGSKADSWTLKDPTRKSTWKQIATMNSDLDTANAALTELELGYGTNDTKAFFHLPADLQTDQMSHYLLARFQGSDDVTKPAEMQVHQDRIEKERERVREWWRGERTRDHTLSD